ncbi:hypothetical protein [Acidocella sp. KAb 2-4]|uniref:hypothetical protein n=1 Tax=Acidocella sp. KAb 2-4 TaxID=2885158 RepID=UPI001D099ADD|nr:hypothetical protein [Acidocella sp. KAb 2-4]MCB5944336.1 hypothetical protein [Acidocella sp. KAb 2-4]
MSSSPSRTMRSVAPERRAAAPDQQQNNDVKRALYKIKPQINIVLRIFEMCFLRFIPDAPPFSRRSRAARSTAATTHRFLCAYFYTLYDAYLNCIR